MKIKHSVKSGFRESQTKTCKLLSLYLHTKKGFVARVHRPQCPARWGRRVCRACHQAAKSSFLIGLSLIFPWSLRGICFASLSSDQDPPLPKAPCLLVWFGTPLVVKPPQLPTITSLLPSFQQDCCCSVTQSCPTLCDPMDCSTPGLPVHHQLPELAQTHVHRVGDAIQPSHPLSSPSPFCLQSFPPSGSFPATLSEHFLQVGLATLCCRNKLIAQLENRQAIARPLACSPALPQCGKYLISKDHSNMSHSLLDKRPVWSLSERKNQFSSVQTHC